MSPQDIVLLSVLALVVVLVVPPIRRVILSGLLLRIVGPMLPTMGDTEREALEAGSVWWDGELFSGNPDFKKLLEFRPRPLSDEEQAFLDGPVEELCAMVSEWKVTQLGDLPEEAWAFLKEKGFFGIIIPTEYGGLGFSARAHTDIVTKISSRCVTAAVSVMVPNALGPAELLLHYGTDEQKKRLLPRLAAGEEIPSFALTGPENGSDAAAMLAEGVVCRDTIAGQEVLGMRLQWEKRYTTLGPVATLIGLAFRLRDPDHLLGDTEDLGITCALIPADLPGIEIGDRHDPMGVPFLNGPNYGRDVFASLDTIIGGPAAAGQGWRMLMDCLSAGRSISLPSLSAGATKLATRVTGAYATVRRQFGLSIGKFEGVAERLARIGGLTYLTDATRLLTAGAVDDGEKPAVLSAVCKAYLTENMRVVVNDSMDVLAGAGISRGPRNVLAPVYQSLPIGITVEGANILARSMIIFGQGAIRCHPYVQDEMKAVAARDGKSFDRAFFGHLRFIARNKMRALWGGLTGGGRAPVMECGPEVHRAFRQLSRLSAGFALTSDAAMITLGGGLKRREMINGRLADALAWMYMASATLKRFVDDGQPEGDLPFLRWAADHALFQTEQALVGVVDNLPNRVAAFGLRRLVFPLGARLRPPKDEVCTQIATALLDGAEARLRLTRGMYLPSADEPGLGQLEAALATIVAAAPAEKKLRAARRDGRLQAAPVPDLYRAAVDAGVLGEEDFTVLCAADGARSDAVEVDAFGQAAFQALRG